MIKLQGASGLASPSCSCCTEQTGGANGRRLAWSRRGQRSGEGPGSRLRPLGARLGCQSDRLGLTPGLPGGLPVPASEAVVGAGTAPPPGLGEGCSGPGAVQHPKVAFAPGWLRSPGCCGTPAQLGTCRPPSVHRRPWQELFVAGRQRALGGSRSVPGPRASGRGQRTHPHTPLAGAVRPGETAGSWPLGPNQSPMWGFPVDPAPVRGLDSCLLPLGRPELPCLPGPERGDRDETNPTGEAGNEGAARGVSKEGAGKGWHGRVALLCRFS